MADRPSKNETNSIYRIREGGEDQLLCGSCGERAAPRSRPLSPGAIRREVGHGLTKWCAHCDKVIINGTDDEGA